MELVVKDMDIATGNVLVVLLNEKDAIQLDLHSEDRIIVKKGKRSVVANLDIAESRKAVPPGKIGCFEEVLDALRIKNGDRIKIAFAPKPPSIGIIRKKLEKKVLSETEIKTIVSDIVSNRLTDVELTSYVIASYMTEMHSSEIISLTKAMRDTGDILDFRNGKVVDLHCIGGVPGNRTTMIVVPILLACGLTVPKTSSRAITSPAGTADTMEVLCSVTLGKKDLMKIVKKVGGFITWGGAVNLAPADDRIIKVEHPLSIDAEGQMLASIMAKKASVSATHLLMDIPYGPGAKVATKTAAEHLEKHFKQIGRALKIKVKCIFTDGSQPVGNGIGPVLEARDVIWLLQNDQRGPADLRRRSLDMAGIILEFVGKVKKGQGRRHADEILRSGKALKAFKAMVKAQKGKWVEPDKLEPAKDTYVLKAKTDGKVACIENAAIAKVARLAGAPQNKNSGVYLHCHCNSKVKKGDPLITIHAHSKRKLKYAMDALKRLHVLEIKK